LEFACSGFEQTLTSASYVATHQDRDFLRTYLAIAPAALALIRANECFELSQLKFTRPILDLGCGDGLFAAQLFSEPLDAGIDLSPAEVARAQRSGMYYKAETANATAQPFADGSFATVFSNGVLEHIRELPGALIEIARVLKREGQLIATMPCSHFSDFLTLPSPTNRLFAHVNLLEPQEWAEKLSMVGLRLIRWKHYNSAAAIRAHERLLVLSAPSFVARRISGRWVPWPRLRRAVAVPFWTKMLRPLYATNVEVGGSVWWIAEKL
jgi:SAM-dependent methyltransferase